MTQLSAAGRPRAERDLNCWPYKCNTVTSDPPHIKETVLSFCSQPANWSTRGQRIFSCSVCSDWGCILLYCHRNLCEKYHCMAARCILKNFSPIRLTSPPRPTPFFNTVYHLYVTNCINEVNLGWGNEKDITKLFYMAFHDPWHCYHIRIIASKKVLHKVAEVHFSGETGCFYITLADSWLVQTYWYISVQNFFPSLIIPLNIWHIFSPVPVLDHFQKNVFCLLSLVTYHMNPSSIKSQITQGMNLCCVNA